MRTQTLLLILVLGTLAAIPQHSVRADIAPPETPPGSTLLPEEDGTAVRMLAETVTLTVEADPQDASRATARTVALFTMHNLGHTQETMAARFPLSFADGSSNGVFEFPEIASVGVKVDGKPISTRRELQPPIETGRGYRERDEVPWAVFDITFPPGKDVVVEVTYSVLSFGYYPQAEFRYILETGSGWHDTIGTADIVVRLPYETSEANVFREESSAAGGSTPDATLSGNEIRWHLEDFEPTWENNIDVLLVTPSLWERIVREKQAVADHPKDGEAWGRLAKAYKEAARLPKGYLRDDPAGQELIDLSRAAYETCLELLPDDPLWHYGFADLLWSEYYWETRLSPEGDTGGLLPRLLSELQATLKLDPDNAQAHDLLLEISMAVDGAVEQVGDEYVFLALTATPLPPTPYLDPGTATPEPTRARASPTAVSGPETPEPRASNPLCANAVLALLLPAAIIVWRRQHP